MDFTAFSLLGLKLHRGLETIHIHPQPSVQFGELSIRELACEAVITHNLAHNLPIFLLNVALVITSLWTATRKGDLLLLTVSHQFHVNELGSIVGIDAQDGKREQLPGALEGSDDRILTAMEQGQAFCPSCSNIGQG